MRSFPIVILAAVRAISAQPTPTSTQNTSIQASAFRSTITDAASFACPPRSTLLTTTDCTYGFLTSYCHSAAASLACPSGSYPSVIHPGHCVTVSTCFPLPTTTATCSNGFTAYSTYTAFAGYLNNVTSTAIKFIDCRCSGSVSFGTDPYASYCLPTGSCASFLQAASRLGIHSDNATTATNRHVYCNCPTGQTRESILLFQSVTKLTC